MTQRTPAISVLLPVRNAGGTLLEAMQSLAVQSERDVEAVIVDDGSTDDSVQIAAEFCRHDSRFRLIECEHRGIVSALATAAAAARGRILARMDADDVSAPARLELQLDYLRQHPEVGVCGTLVEHFGEPAAVGRQRYLDWINRLRAREEIEAERFVECPIPHPTFMMRREAFDAAGGYVDRGWPEDHDLLLRVHRSGWRLGKISEPLLRWRHSSNRHSMTDPRYQPEQFRALKRHHLFDTVLAGRRPFYQWGAGEVGKPWLREWGNRAPVAVVDINPRKIDTSIHSMPVISPDDLPAPGDFVTLVAVGATGARDEIRAWFVPRGYIECRDFWFIA